MTEPTSRERYIRQLLYNMTGPSPGYAAWVSLRDDAKFLLGLLDEARSEKMAAVAAERARCAKIARNADTVADKMRWSEYADGYCAAREAIAEAIERGEEKRDGL